MTCGDAGLLITQPCTRFEDFLHTVPPIPRAGGCAAAVPADALRANEDARGSGLPRECAHALVTRTRSPRRGRAVRQRRPAWCRRQPTSRTPPTTCPWRAQVGLPTGLFGVVNGGGLRTKTAWAVTRNLVVAGCGAYLIFQTLMSTAVTYRDLRLDESLDEAKSLAGQGRGDAAAAIALEVLEHRPRSVRAQLQFVCYSWMAQDYDAAAELLQRNLRYLSLDTFQQCRAKPPLDQVLAVMKYDNSTVVGQLYLTDAVRDSVKPSAADAISMGPYGPAVWVGLACRNLHSGLPGLAQLQMEYAENGGIDIAAEVRKLPKAWACAKESK